MTWDDDLKLLNDGCADAFGEAILYKLKGTSEFLAINDIFDDPGETLDNEQSTQGFEGLSLWLRVRDESLPTVPQQRDRVVRIKDGKIYDVSLKLPDGGRAFKLGLVLVTS